MVKISTKLNSLLAAQLVNTKKVDDFKRLFLSFYNKTEKVKKIIDKKVHVNTTTDAEVKKIYTLKIQKSKATYVSIARWKNACESINFKALTDAERKWAYELMILLQVLISQLNKRNKGWQEAYKKVFMKCVVATKLTPIALNNYKFVGIQEINKITKLVQLGLQKKQGNSVGVIYSFILYLIEHLENATKGINWTKPEILKVEQFYDEAILDLVSLHKVFSSSRSNESLKANTYFDAQSYRLQKLFSMENKNPAERLEVIWDYFSEIGDLEPKQKRMRILNKEFIDKFFGSLYDEMENRKGALSKDLANRFIKYIFDSAKKRIELSETQDTINTLLIILTVVVFLNMCV